MWRQCEAAGVSGAIVSCSILPSPSPLSFFASPSLLFSSFREQGLRCSAPSDVAVQLHVSSEYAINPLSAPQPLSPSALLSPLPLSPSAQLPLCPSGLSPQPSTLLHGQVCANASPTIHVWSAAAAYARSSEAASTFVTKVQWW
jgi:hypothetical protein